MKTIQNILKPLSNCALQSYLGTGVHTLGLLNWILKQVGRADVYVSTFSTSEEFLSGFYSLHKKGLLKHTELLADIKAAKKTVKLKSLMVNCFDAVYLGQNHSKVILVQTEAGQTVSVISSQNQTYGGRAECTIITTSQEIFFDLFCGFTNITKNSILLNGLHKGTTGINRGTGEQAHSILGNFRPFGIEE